MHTYDQLHEETSDIGKKQQVLLCNFVSSLTKVICFIFDVMRNKTLYLLCPSSAMLLSLHINLVWNTYMISYLK